MTTRINDWQRRLWTLGMVQFLIGLLTGLVLAVAPQVVANPRGLLASHLEAVMNGSFVILVGFLWPKMTLTPRVASFAGGLLLYGTFANWFATAVAGFVGTSEATPIAGAGHHAGAGYEKFVLLVLTSVALAMTASVTIFVRGLIARPLTMENAPSH